MDRWDPMSHDYHNSKFNSYKQGVGRDLTASGQTCVKLHARNIPVELGKNGVINLFMEYGEVYSVDLFPPRFGARCTSANVTMMNTVGAEAALHYLSGRRIANQILQVFPAKTDEQKREDEMRRRMNLEFERSLSGAFPMRRNQPYTSYESGYNPGFSSQKQFQSRKSSPPEEKSGPLLLGKSKSSGAGLDNVMWHSLAEAASAESSNALLPKLSISIGRGSARQVVETRPGHSQIERKQKMCVKCLKPDATYKCSLCHMYYCTLACQKEDFEKHKPYCMALSSKSNDKAMGPGGDGSVKSMESSYGYSTDTDEISMDYESSSRHLKSLLQIGSKDSKTTGKLQNRPQTKQYTANSKSTNSMMKSKPADSTMNSRPVNTKNREERPPFNGTQNKPKISVSQANKQSSTIKASMQQQKPKVSKTSDKEKDDYSSELSPKKNENSSLSSADKISGLHMDVGQTSMATLAYFENPFEIFVNLTDYMEELANLTIEMSKDYDTKSLEHVKKVKVGDAVAVKFQEEWSRAKVKTVQGRSVTIEYIDCGNIETVPLEEVFPLFLEFLTTPAQALCLCLSNLKPKDSRDWSPQATNAIIEYLGMPYSQTLQVKVIEKRGEKYAVDIKADQAKLSLLDMCIKKGYAVKVDDQPGLPSIASKKPENGKKATGMNAQNLRSSPIKKEQPAKVHHLPCSTLPDNCDLVNVSVTFVENCNKFYVILTDQQQKLEDFSDSIAKEVVKQAKVKTPETGDYVLAKYVLDDRWYRARIISNQKQIFQVLFVDYGNTESVQKDDLKEMSSKLFEFPSQAIECKLDGKTDNLSEESQSFFKMLENQHVKVKLIKKTPLTNIVRIFDGETDITNEFLGMASQQCSNDKEQGIETHSEDKEHGIETMNDSFSFASFPQNLKDLTGVVMHGNSLHQLNILLVENQVAFIEMLSELCTQGDSFSPLTDPKVGSTCAAKFSEDFSWYRARIEKMVGADSCIVRFVDFGNSEETKVSDLKQLSKEFLAVPIYTIQCCLSGHEAGLESSDNVEDEVLSKRIDALLKDKSVFIEVVDHVKNIPIVKLRDEHGICFSNVFPSKDTKEKQGAPTLNDILITTPEKKVFEPYFCHFVNWHEFYCYVSEEKNFEVAELSEALAKDFEELGERIETVTPIVNGIYCSNYEGLWYRCVVQKIVNSQVEIKYIDYGNVETIDSKKLRPIKLERLTLPISLLKCKLSGFAQPADSWDMVNEFIKQEAIGFPNLLEIVDEIDDGFLVILYVVDKGERINFAEYLINKGLLLPSKAIIEKAAVSNTRKLEENTIQPEEQSPSDEDSDEDGLQKKMEEIQKQLELVRLRKSRKKD